MSYTPKSEEQLTREGLLEPGVYDFEVIETSDKPSKAGNAMITLRMHLFDQDGTARSLTDYIALGNNFGERKLRHAAVAAGILDIYNTGNMTSADFFGKSGKIKIKVQEGNIEFPNPKNVVEDYIARDEQASSPAPRKESAATGALIDDEVPF